MTFLYYCSKSKDWRDAQDSLRDWRYDTVLRKFGDLRWVWARCESVTWAWNLSTEYWVPFYNHVIGSRQKTLAIYIYISSGGYSG